MPREYADTDELRGARFLRADLAGAVFRDVDLRGARIIDAVLVDAEVSGLIDGLTVNGVPVAPLVEAELDRRFPERLLLRAIDASGLRTAWDAVQAMWQPTLDLARDLPEAVRQERVDGEWSLVETLRHLVFVTDAWFSHAVLGEADPYHPAGLVPAFLERGVSLGVDPSAHLAFEEVLAIRTDRIERVRTFLAAATDGDLARPRANPAGGYPPPTEHTVLGCLHVVMDEEWNHHQYAVRDLAVLTSR